MQFRLTYEGLLLGASSTDTRASHKHEIRRVFHRQLRRFWEVTPTLRDRIGAIEGVPTRQRDVLAKYFSKDGYRFVPLVVEHLSLSCRLDILFLRPDPPGSLIRSGDIDNRLKTLLDSLRMPSGVEELGGYNQPSDGEDPFFVLLQDDKLITHVSVETDVLHEPTGDAFDVNDARLVITVTIRPVNLTWANIYFG